MAQAKLVFIAARAQITGAHPKSSTAPVGSPVRTVYAEFLASLRERPLADLSSDLHGAIQRAAEEMAGRVE